MAKVNFFDARIVKKFSDYTSTISTIFSLLLIFIDIPTENKITLGVIFLFILSLLYFGIWLKSNNLMEVNLDVEGSIVTVKAGDLFQQDGFKVIAFNEYFDTQVDDNIISHKSLNGLYIDNHLSDSIPDLDERISNFKFDVDEILEVNHQRKIGKKQKYSLGTIFVNEDYLLTAFSKFDDKNRAFLTMPDYLGFLINFWDKVNRIYAQKSVSVPIFGSGITRIKEHKNISDEDLLKIMLWTFRISEMRFKFPAKLTIVIHNDKIDKINLLDIKSARNGL
ncbi:macro domain-containing protein [Brenneria populi subsp. brevivirga]|uniref:macro domain-containing protein n=1 Tax=Brenneria populi TaxID=1505588 RepID=UPI002E19FBA8|nr:macro domain-containing protein [Brenneria populi subsp. brevivirga]